MRHDRKETFGTIAVLLHWTIALLFLGQFALGLSMTRVKGMALQFELIQWHKSFGFLILGLAVLRLGWRLGAGRPRPSPALSPVERASAAIVQALLLAATIAVPLAGWALASTSTLGVPTLAFKLVLIPHLPLVPSEQAEAFWRQMHGFLAWATILLAAAHAGAALRHHLLLRDDVLARMLPILSPRRLAARQTTTESDDA
jgi:cytochrome b561